MKTKVLFFCSDYKVGLTTALTEQAIELNKCSELDLYCVSSEKEMEVGLHQKIVDNGIKMTIINSLDVHAGLKNLAEKIAKLIEHNAITHVNVHNNWQLAVVSYVKYMRLQSVKFKIIYTIHGYRHNSAIKSVFAISIIGIALLLFADRVLSMSNYVSKKFWFINYKTDLVFYIMNKPEFNKASNGIVGSPLTMVFPAQFRRGKNQDILIKAVKEYIEKTKDNSVRLYLPGDGVLLNKYKEFTQQLGLDKNVIFPGKLSHRDVVKLYEDSNVALVSSNVETYGRCIAEPFALGRCVITKKTGVALDIIRNYENGIFFSSYKDLADILLRLHNNPSVVERLGNKAFEDKVVFSAPKVVESYVNAIRKA